MIKRLLRMHEEKRGIKSSAFLLHTHAFFPFVEVIYIPLEISFLSLYLFLLATKCNRLVPCSILATFRQITVI